MTEAAARRIRRRPPALATTAVLPVAGLRRILLGDGASRAEPRSGAHATGIDGAKGNLLPRDGCFALLRRAVRA
jgi:hypothetical protein